MRLIIRGASWVGGSNDELATGQNIVEHGSVRRQREAKGESALHGNGDPDAQEQLMTITDGDTDCFGRDVTYALNGVDACQVRNFEMICGVHDYGRQSLAFDRHRGAHVEHRQQGSATHASTLTVGTDA